MNAPVSNPSPVTFDQLESRLSDLLASVIGEEAQDLDSAALRWTIPKDPTFGDLSNPLPFRFASQRKCAPIKIAAEFADVLMAKAPEFGLDPWIERVEPKAGFLNIFLTQWAMCQVLKTVRERGETFGHQTIDTACKICIEFLSANPTGPLSVAHGRQAAVGDVLCRLLRSQGYEVTAEYYLNDEGRQIELLGKSVRLRYLELLGKAQSFIEDGYHGEYIKDVAEAFRKRYGDEAGNQTEEESLPLFMKFSREYLLAVIRNDLDYFGLNFDQWSSQEWVRTSGRIEYSLKKLEETESLFEDEGAVWFASSKFGDDKDRVIRKQDGDLTYLAPDIAYHAWKYERGYEALLNLWGPDHHGYIPRMNAAMQALGLNQNQLTVRIVQLVTLSRGGKPVRMSKRAGEFVTFREILEEVGVDATRFFYVMRTMESHLDFDLDLAKSQSQENPVYYIQYAHARICSILKKKPVDLPEADLAQLREPEEHQLIRALLHYPMVLRACAVGLEPHGITTYLRKLAETFHVFYTRHRVVGDDPALTSARCELIRAARTVLANGLGLLGISSPEKM